MQNNTSVEGIIFSVISSTQGNITTNDVLFFATHIILFACFFFGLYRQYIAAPLRRTTRKFFDHLRTLRRRIASRVKTTARNLQARATEIYDKLRITRNKTHTIHPDSILLEAEVGEPTVKVMRNDSTSWDHFTLAWTVISVLFTTIVSTYSPPEVSDYSLAIILADLFAITWLCFYSSWFTNKIITVIKKRIQTPY